MKMIWAVVRSGKVESIARALKSIGVSGCTVSRVRGYGEEWHLYEPLIHGGHHKLETIVEENQVDKAVKLITEHASTGIEGDGILSVFDLGTVVNIRSKEKVKKLLDP
ncbi:MAG: P-II family nitrogen regulator [Deltaproteobacteria bacterium]|nr:P-II family nitrogen regulator [Deltaproteobacteria bacterium]